MSNEMKDWLVEREAQQKRSYEKGMCMYCDDDSEWNRIWQDTASLEWYLNVDTGMRDAAGELIYLREQISYCPYCGRMLGE